MKKSFIRNGILLLVAAIAACGCSSKISDKSTEASSFESTGNSDGGMIKLVRRPGSVLGQGELDGRTFTLSAVTQWQARGWAVFEDGTSRPITVYQNANGESLIVSGLGHSLNFEKTDTPAFEFIGPFDGEYSGDAIDPLHLTLLQNGDLVCGIGQYGDRTVNVVAKVKAVDQLSGYLYFSDESSLRIDANALDDTLKVVGLGKPLILRKIN